MWYYMYVTVTREGEGKKNSGLQKQELSKNKAGMEQETSMTDKHDWPHLHLLW